MVKEVSLVGENVTELPIVNSDESLLQIFVSCKDQGLKTCIWRGLGTVTIAEMLSFIRSEYADSGLPIQSFYAPRYRRFLTSLYPKTCLYDVFVNADIVTFKALGLGGSLYASMNDTELDELHEDTLLLLSEAKKLLRKPYGGTYSFNECLFDEEVQFELGGRNEEVNRVGGSY
jgi:hypothetical protein